MISWLIANAENPPSLKSLRKAELFQLVTSRMPKEETYVIDQILYEHGHTVLQLPPYYPDLNPIELIWTDLKKWVASRKINSKMKNVGNLCR